MKHLGDITKINGAEIEKVDVITFGAPCQDISVAGLRRGMKSDLMGDEENTRSGLFFHAVRIIKEMREDDKRRGTPDDLCRCRMAVYENVPGALSSNKGRDWQAVLTEIIRIAEPQAPDVPMPDKWPTAGCFYDELGGWSVAYRIFDSQFWGPTYFNADGSIRKCGTPQRRRRIALVADFAGLCAPEVLFERESLHRHTQSGGEARKSPAGDTEESAGESV